MQKRMLHTKNLNISEPVLKKLMYATDELANDVGTILIGKEAVDYGLIDEVGGFSEALAKLYELIREKKG